MKEVQGLILSGQRCFDGGKDGVAVLAADENHFAGGDHFDLGGFGDGVLVFQIVLHGALLAGHEI